MRIAHSIRTFWTASIRRQLMLGIILVHAVLMSIFVYDLVQRQRNFLQNQTTEQALSLAGTLAGNSVSWMLANDVYGLKEVLSSLLQYPDLRYAMVLSPEGRVLGHSQFDRVGKYVNDSISLKLLTSNSPEQHILVQDNFLVDVAVPVYVHNHHIGWARVGLGQDKIRSGLQIITRDGLIYTLIAIVVGATFAFFMAAGITRGLRQLVQVADGVREGDRSLRSRLQRPDELGDLARDLNLMLDTLDAHEQQQSLTQQALRDSEGRLRSYTQALPDPVLILDEHGRYIEVLSPYPQLLYLPPDQLIGRRVQDVLPADTADAIMDTLHKTLNSNTPQSLEYSLIMNDQTYWFEGRTAVLPGTLDGARAVVWLAHDITALKNSMAQREQLQKQLFQSQKMEAIGQLTGGIAHDFNNMLASIVGYTELARDRFSREQGGKLDEYLSQVEKAAERAKTMIQQMLAYSRNAPGQPQVFLLAPVIKEAMGLLSSTLLSSVKLRINIEDENTAIQGDPVQLHQIVMNLVINARDALNNAGTIDIGLRPARHRTGHCSSCHAAFDGDYVELYVQDTGSGIHADHLNTIFDPFFTTKDIGKGTGMGLSMVHGITHSYDGHILVETNPGDGTRMRLFFPKVVKGQA